MADNGIKVSAMTEATSLGDSDLLMAVQSNENKKIKASVINTYVKNNAVAEEAARAKAAESALSSKVEEISSSPVISNLTGWSGVKQLCASGNASLAFSVGDTISEPWIDTASNNTSYDNPWRVNHFEDVTDDNGNTIHGMWLQTQYTYPFDIPFSHERAFYACPDGLSAGTYNITFGADWNPDAHVKNGESWYFTLTKDVEAGGRLAGFYRIADTAQSAWKVYSYGSDGITVNETVSVSKGTTGTNLGTMKLGARNGNLNSIQETGYGCNRWKNSALRQYLNSEKTKGNWWTPQDAWDIAPSQLSTKDGFLCGINDDMLESIATTKVTTYTNTVNDGGEADVTYDKVILPSLEQMYIAPQVSGEGESQEYWKQLNGTDTKWAQWQTYEILKQFSVSNHTSAQYCRLRSAYRGSASNAFYLFTSGVIGNGGACWANAFEPLIFIGG